jgi:hypothetical protein
MRTPVSLLFSSPGTALIIALILNSTTLIKILISNSATRHNESFVRLCNEELVKRNEQDPHAAAAAMMMMMERNIPH